MGRDDDEVPNKVRRLASDSGGSLENSSFSLDDDPQQELLAAIREEDAVLEFEELSQSTPCLGYFGSEAFQIPAENAWVLCINHNFDGFRDPWPRNGNREDVQNIKQVFSSRKCNVKELTCAPKSKILKHFQSEEALLDLFKPDDKDKVKPSVFILFLLTHGGCDGQVVTDHTVDPSVHPKKVEHHHFESYNVSEVWDGLKNMSFAADCLFILFFGPCRGFHEEVLFHSGSPGSDDFLRIGLTDNSCRLLREPNAKNFVIFYSTVENTSSFRDGKGSNMVLNLCNELRTIAEDQPLEVFLTRVKRSMFHHTNDEGQIQTPELRLFPGIRFTIYANTEYEPANSKPNLFYEWTSSNNNSSTRGRALFFGRQSNIKRDLITAFINLGFQIKDCKTEIETTLDSTAAQSFENEQALVVCVMSEVCVEHPEGHEELCVRMANDTVIPIKKITTKFVGSNCRALVNKPKMFFFLDVGQRTDRFYYNPPTTTGELREGSNHSGIYIVVATSKVVISGILEALRCPSLQNDSSLQELMTSVIQQFQTPERIMPQITSTMNWLVNFPLLPDISIEPVTKMTGSKSVKKVVNFLDETGKTFIGTMQRDSVSFVSGGSSTGQERVVSRLAQTLATSHPNHLILKVDLELADVKSVKFETARDLLNILLRQSRFSLAQFVAKAKENAAVIFVTGVTFLQTGSVELYQKVVEKLSTLNIPLFISVRDYDLDLVKDCVGEKSTHFIEVMPLNRSALVQTLKTKLDCPTSKCYSILQSMDFYSGNCLLSDPSNLPIFYHLLLEEKMTKIPTNLFSFFEAYVRSVVHKFMTKERGPNTKTFIYDVLIQFALKHYDNSIAVLTDELKKMPQFCQFSEKLEFWNNNLVHFLVTLSVLFKQTRPWKSQIRLKEILSQRRFRQVRRFLDSFFAQEEQDSEVYLSRNTLKNEIFNCADDELLRLVCEEGLFNLFNVVFRVKLTLEKEKWLKSCADECLRLASFSNEDLAEALINLGADFLPVLEKWLDRGLLHSAAARGAFALVNLIIMEMRYTQEMELKSQLKQDGSSSQSQEETLDMGVVDKYLRDAVNARGQLGCAPLHLAAEVGDTRIVNLLISQGADVTLLDNSSNRWTPLHYAVLHGHRRATTILLKALETKWGNCIKSYKLRLGLHVLLDKGSDAVARPRDQWMELQQSSLRVYQDLLAFLVQNRKQVVDDAVKGRSAAFTAVEKGRLDILKILLDCGAKPDETDVGKWTLLHVAAETGNVEITDFLNIMPVDRLNNQSQTALEVAVSRSHVGVVELLLERRAVASFAALCQAALRLDRHCCERLVEAGAPLAGPGGRTVLHMAAEESSLEALQLMVKFNADASAVDDQGFAPLHVSASKVNGLACVNFLLTLGVNVDERTANALTPLHLAAEIDAVETVQMLLDHGADPSLKDVNGRSALHCAANSPECLELLLECKSVVVDDPINDGRTVIQLAERAGCVRSLNVLKRFLATKTGTKEQTQSLFVKASQERLMPKSKPKLKLTANKRFLVHQSLHEAVIKYKKKRVQELVDRGANVNATFGEERQTPLHLAAIQNYVTIVEILLAVENIDVDARDLSAETPLHMAARKGSTRIGRILVKNRASLEAENFRGQRPLHVALESGHVTFAEFLMESGANLKARTFTQATPLHVAAGKCKTSVVRSLVKRGADVRACDIFGKVPLHCAAAEGKLENVKFLLRKCKDGVQLVDKEANTALHLAARGGHIDVVKLLVAKGADTTNHNCYNRIPLHVTKDAACVAFLKGC